MEGKTKNTIPEELIKPMLDAFNEGKTVEEVAAVISRPANVVKAKLIRMGYLANGTADAATERRFKALESNAVVTAQLISALEARINVLEKKPSAAAIVRTAAQARRKKAR